MKNKILIIIPAYNEEENILDTYNSIEKYNKKYKTNYDVIVINDGSKDQTSNICHENNIPVIDLVHNLGIGGAVQTGYKYAYEYQYDIAIQFDGDGQHNVEFIKDLIEPLINKEVDMTIGSRFIEKSKEGFKSTRTRYVGITIIALFIKLFSRRKIKDTTSGFRACNQKVIKYFCRNYPPEYPEPVSSFELLRNGYKILEIPVSMNERKGGESSINNAFKKIYYMINVVLSIFVVWLRGENK